MWISRCPRAAGAPNPQPQVTGRMAIRAFMPQLLDNADTVHQVHTPIITLALPNAAEAIWAMEDIVKLPGFHLEGRGHYRETYRLVAGKWHIASLHLTRTWLNILEGGETGPAIQAEPVSLSAGRANSARCRLA